MAVPESPTVPPAAAALGAAAGVWRALPVPVLLYLAAVMIPLGTTLGGLVLTDLRILLLVMIIPLGFRLLSGAYGGVMATDVLFIAYVAWGTLALAVDNPDRVVQYAGSTGVEFLGGYVLARAYIRSAETFAALTRALIWLVAATLPIALYETVTSHPIVVELLHRLPGVTASVEPAFTIPRFGFTRVQAVFAHPIHYGLFCTIAFSLCFVGLRGAMADTRRYLLSAVCAVCALLSLSAGPMLALALQAMLILWVTLLRGVKSRWLILLGLFVLAYVAIDLASNRTPYKVFLTYATFSSGTAYWRDLILQWGLYNVGQNPVFGIGLNDWVRPVFMYSSSVDNFWLLAAMRYGIPGFALLAAGYGWSLWRVGLRDFDADPGLYQLRRAWMFSLVGLSFTLVTVDVWGTLYSFVFFLYGAGMWLLTATPGTAAAGAEAAPARGLRLRRDHDLLPVFASAAKPVFRRAPTAEPGRPAQRLTRFPPGTRPEDGRKR